MATRDVATSTDDTDSLRYQESRFFEAIKNDDEDTVESMLGDEAFYHYLNAVDKLALAFVQAVLLNNVNLVNILVAHGADISVSDCMFEENGVMHAARYGHTEMLAFLMSAGVSVNKRSEKSGSTALHVAVENGKHESLKVLVQQSGVNLNIKDCSGYSPLLWCARLRDWRAMEILINAGCDVYSKSFHNDETALHITVDNIRAFWKGKLVGPEDIMRCINLLVNSGIDINVYDCSGIPPLIYAIRSDNIVALKQLVKLNCDISCKSLNTNELLNNNELLLQWMKRPNFNLVKVEAKDQELLPLYLALSKLQLRSLKILCLSGAKYHRLASEAIAMMTYIDNSQHIKEWLLDCIYTPMSLKMCCRREIRQSLRQGVMTKSHELDIPESLREYVSLCDIDHI